jgi:hypothetical protein
MTQGLHRRIATLERGLTPIAAQGHIVILGGPTGRSIWYANWLFREDASSAS